MHLDQSAAAPNSNGSRPAVYAYPVQSTSQTATEVTSSVATAGAPPTVAILQTALSGNFSPRASLKAV